jgi:hypothetical protein
MLTTYHSHGYIRNHFLRRCVAVIDMPWSCERSRYLAGDESDYKVGPGNPPLHTRSRKGQSGNPGGRSRKSLAFRPIQKIRLATADQCSHQKSCHTDEGGCQKILRTAKFFVPAKAGTQEQATETPGFPLSRE